MATVLFVTLQATVWAVMRGALDSLRGALVLFRVDRAMNEKSRGGRGKSQVLARVCQCCALNGGVFLTSILVFYWAVLPGLRALLSSDGVWAWTRPALALVFETVWVLPLFALSKVVNSLWFQDIADWSYRYSSGTRPRPVASVSRLVADSLASLLVQVII